jgi:hypothetical protein
MMTDVATFTDVITRLDRVTQYSETPAMEIVASRNTGSPLSRGDSNGRIT